MARPIPPWFVKRPGPGWRVTVRGWIAMALFAVLFVACLVMLQGVTRIFLSSLLVMVALALCVAKVDLRRLGVR